MTAAGRTQTGAITDIDGVTVPVGTDYDCVFIGVKGMSLPVLVDSASFRELIFQLAKAWESGPISQEMPGDPFTFLMRIVCWVARNAS